MSLANYSPDLYVLTVNGRILTDYGETTTPVTDAPIDPKSVLRRGQGGNAVRIDRTNPGRAVSIFLNPGGPDSAYMQALFTSNANISLSALQIGTLEASVGVEGVIVNDTSNGRGGSVITDDQYNLEFNVWTATKGGV